MKLLSTSVAVVSLIAAADAYPNMARVLEHQRAETAKRQGIPFPKIGGIPRVLPVGFNAAEQLVSVDGDHAFQAPGSDDQRGPCAGLNAAANHGYIPRDGIATYASIETGLWEAFGLDQTATQVLQQTTSFFDGDPISQKWSIGGFSPKTAALAGALGFLGQESGICGYGHAKSENDASITRGDFLAPTMNSNCASYPVFFQQILDQACADGDCNSITMATLAKHQDTRKKYSIANNPNYFSPPFAGVAFTPAAHHFVFALMANHSAEYPQGLLTPETLMDFFSYSRDSSGALQYKYGYERIPRNWYKRALSDPWTLPDILTGVAQQCLAYPDTCAIGGNTGTVNSFAGVQVGDISGGVFGAEALTDPYKLGCFLSQNIQAQAPSFLSNVLQGPLLTQALGLLTSSLVPTLAQGFGDCNGINVRGGNGAAGAKTYAQWATQFPGAKIQTSGPRATSPSP